VIILTLLNVVCRILNKLTPEKFDKLSLELLNVGIDSQTVLKGIILLVIAYMLFSCFCVNMYSPVTYLYTKPCLGDYV